MANLISIDYGSVIGGGGTELLWTNPSPTASYDTNQTLSLDFSNYDVIVIEFQVDVGDTPMGKTWGAKNVGEASPIVGSVFYNSTNYVCGRTITSFTNNSITFGTPLYGNMSGIVTNRNNTGVPLRIYGTKLNI